LRGRFPENADALKKWHAKHPEFFVKRVYHQAVLDACAPILIKALRKKLDEVETARIGVVISVCLMASRSPRHPADARHGPRSPWRR
jgi:hypothetical protein